MKTRVLLGTAALAGAVIVLGQMNVIADSDAVTSAAAPGGSFEPIGGPIGPDVIVGAIPSTVRWSTDGTETSYSIATTSCNIGDTDLDWVSSPSERHPVIGQNLYRWKDGRFEQIGQSWLKHSFCALQLPLGGCGTCSGPGGCLSRLTPGCSDPYSASRNGSQGGLGPKFEVNVHTGEFNVPWAQGEGTSGQFRRRLRVKNVDVDPALNAGAKYFVAASYTTLDDAASDNRHNNSSYRAVSVSSGSFNLNPSGPTFQQQEAIRAWQAIEGASTVTLLDVFTPEQDVDGGMSDARFVVGYSVKPGAEKGTWDYEYAIYNQDSHRSGSSFSVPAPGVTVTEVGFHDVDYHSGEPWDGTDWEKPADGSIPNMITWSTDAFTDNAEANALRWDTTYNFRFTADSPPVDVEASLGLFRPGGDPSVSFIVKGPMPKKTGDCPQDLDMDGDVGFTDLLSVLSAWGPCVGCDQDFDMDDDVGFTDLLSVLSAWGPCP